MTWKRVATAAVLIPVFVGLVLWGSTIVVALVLALVMLLALFEYFALGDAMGHRAYRLWTATCALMILYLQWLTTAVRWGEFGGITYPSRLVWLLHRFFPRAEDAVFLFVLGISLITLATRRPIVEALPSGYRTQLGKWFKDGRELSGGQWQKIALARAFMRKEADILVLDEPTAAIDAAAEAEVFEHFRELTRNRIAIVISHRFSTVRMADQILVLEEGRIVERGSHDSLIGEDGRYAKLFTLQARGYR